MAMAFQVGYSRENLCSGKKNIAAYLIFIKDCMAIPVDFQEKCFLDK